MSIIINPLSLADMAFARALAIGAQRLAVGVHGERRTNFFVAAIALRTAAAAARNIGLAGEKVFADSGLRPRMIGRGKDIHARAHTIFAAAVSAAAGADRIAPAYHRERF